MNVRQSKQEKHRIKIAKEVEFAQQHTSFYGSIRLRNDHTYTKIAQNSIPGLVKSISINEISIHATIEDGNTKLGKRKHNVLITDIEKISVEKDINFKIIYPPEMN